MTMKHGPGGGTKPRRAPKLRTAFRQRERRYPIWSGKSIIMVGLIAAVVTGLVVMMTSQKSLLVELEMMLAIVAAGLFAFLSAGLYFGVRIKKREVLADNLKLYDGTGLDSHQIIGDVAGAADDPLGCLLGLVLGLLVSVLFTLLILIFVNVAIVLLFLFMLLVGWVFHRALRTVFACSRQCRGKLLPSIGYAGFYTILYTGWLLGILLAVDYLR